MITDAMLDAVAAHASNHYDTDGWDYVVETMDRADLREYLIDGFLDGRPVTTEAEAIACIGERCRLLDDRRRDICATAW